MREIRSIDGGAIKSGCNAAFFAPFNASDLTSISTFVHLINRTLHGVGIAIALNTSFGRDRSLGICASAGI